MAADTIRKFAELAPLSLDLAHPLIRNKLQTAYIGGFAIGKAGPRLPTKVGSPPLSANNAGVAVRTTHTTGLNLGSVEANANPWTIAAIITPVAWAWVINGNGLIGVQSTSNDTAYDRGIFFSSGVTFSAYLFDGAVKQAAGGGAVVGGRSYRVVAVANGSTIKLYVDGIEAASLATSNTGFTAHSAPKLFIGAIGSISSTDDQAVSYALHTGFAWSAADVKTWSNDPYAVLDRRSRRRLFGVSSGGSTLTATLIEATAGTDLASASAVLSASLLDAAAATDITSAQPTVARSLVDAAGGVDLVNTGAVVNGTLVEGVSALDLSSALATLSVTVNEAVTAAELLAATRIANVAATEAAAGVDISSTGTSLSGSLVDAVVSADALSAAATLVASVLEAGGVVDQIHAAAQLVVLLTESAAGSDVVSRPAVYSVTATELVAALDVLSAAIGAAGLDPSARYTITAKRRRLEIRA